MKVCFIVGSFPYMNCGVGDYTSMLSNALAKENVEIHVITSKEAIQQENIQVHNIIKKFDLSSVKTIINSLKEINPDIVHIQYPSHGFNKRLITSIILPIIIKLKIKCKLVDTVHEYQMSAKRKLFLWINYLLMNGTVFVEDEYKEMLKRDYKLIYKRLNLTCIPVGASIPKSVLSKEEKEKLKEDLGLKENKVITYFGFARPSKGIEDLLEAIKVIDDKSIKLLYIGELKDSKEYEKSLLDKIDELNIRDRIVFTGYVKQNVMVANYLSISDVCVLPYIDGVKERYTSFLAACNNNIKVITTSNEEKSQNGIFYINSRDYKLLSKKILEVININTGSNQPIKQWSDIAREYIEFYSKILKGEEK